MVADPDAGWYLHLLGRTDDALPAELDAEMAVQLARVRAWEAAGEFANTP